MGLREYKKKRRFEDTPEPAEGGKRGRGIFVVQLHHASHRHYDFRLELDGVLKSWAVPKGPSFDPSVKRLAMQVEDHPISYATFEGDIPKGQYGGGHVDVFDRGTWTPEGESSARAALKKGELKFTLHGDVLRGSWVLVRTRPQGKKNQWLLIKHRDEFAGARDVNDFVDPTTDHPVSLTERRKTWKGANAVHKAAAALSSDAKDKGARRRKSQPGIDVSNNKATAQNKKMVRRTKDPKIALTHPEREVFAGTGISKLDVARYYVEIAPLLLKEISDRPLATLRCPDGTAGTCFFQKHLTPGLGDYVRSVRVKQKTETRELLYVENVEGLLELVQMNVLEFHPWGAKVEDVERADRVVFDLDPHPDVPWKRVVGAARDVKAQLERIGLQSFLRTSGGKGLHVVVPVNPAQDWAIVKRFAQAFAQAMSKVKPNEYVAVSGVRNRDGLIFIDWLRNGRGATAIASYSLRARESAGVAFPIGWSELGRLKGGDAYTIHDAAERVAARPADPWNGIGKVRQQLPE
jgi:bifunctional non-homologous end joining protein LigD